LTRFSVFRTPIPPHAFLLADDSAAYLLVRRDPRLELAEARRVPYPDGGIASSSFGTPVFARTAFENVVAEGRTASNSRLSRASVVIPDSWTRTVTLEFEGLPSGEGERREILAWRLKKLMAVRVEDLQISYQEIPSSDGQRRLLVATVPQATVSSLEDAFAAFGVRIGRIVPETVALFDGFDARLAAAAGGGDYLLVHRTSSSLVLVIARGGVPLLWRQRAAVPNDEAVAEEARLCLSYYADKHAEGGLAAVFVRDVGPVRSLYEYGEFPFTPQPLSSRLLAADPSLDERNDFLAGVAAVTEGS
jgi:hypothetical protein